MPVGEGVEKKLNRKTSFIIVDYCQCGAIINNYVIGAVMRLLAEIEFYRLTLEERRSKDLGSVYGFGKISDIKGCAREGRWWAMALYVGCDGFPRDSGGATET